MTGPVETAARELRLHPLVPGCCETCTDRGHDRIVSLAECTDVEHVARCVIEALERAGYRLVQKGHGRLSDQQIERLNMHADGLPVAPAVELVVLPSAVPRRGRTVSVEGVRTHRVREETVTTGVTGVALTAPVTVLVCRGCGQRWNRKITREWLERLPCGTRKARS